MTKLDHIFKNRDLIKKNKNWETNLKFLYENETKSIRDGKPG